MELTKIFENIIAQGIKEKTFHIDKHTAKIVANNRHINPPELSISDRALARIHYIKYRKVSQDAYEIEFIIKSV